MSLLGQTARRNTAIIAAAIGILFIAIQGGAATQVKLQTNPRLLVAYPYFSVKLVPVSTTQVAARKTSTNNLQPVNTNIHSLANPHTDSKPFALSEVAYYEVVTGGHSFGLMRHNLHKLKL
jgi:hypothetical protein